jgi:lipopolysaccharide transport system ATP-binding protein
MAENHAISVHNVSKIYRTWERPKDLFVAGSCLALAIVLPKTSATGSSLRHYAAGRRREFTALRDINLEIRRGEAVGIVGRNGSGKSTLLQIIAGTLAPTIGEVEVNGRTAALLELGSGFNPDFTGRENVFLNAAVLGISRAETLALLDDILAFADIGDFIDQPVKTYSSGMVLRLAFAVQVQVNPEILIIDEALAVGDALFQKRCFQKMESLIAGGTTLLFVSHDQESVRTLTQRSILLRDGRIAASGPSAEVMLEYRRHLHDAEKAYFHHVSNQMFAKTAAATAKPGRMSFGDLDAEVMNVTTTDEAGQPKSHYFPGETIRIVVDYSIYRPLDHLSFGIRLRNKEGHKVYSWGTQCQDIAIWAGQDAGQPLWERHFVAGDAPRVVFTMECRLGANFYEIQATVAQSESRYSATNRTCHWKDEAAFFHVGLKPMEYMFNGLVDLKAKVTLELVS